MKFFYRRKKNIKLIIINLKLKSFNQRVNRKRVDFLQYLKWLVENKIFRIILDLKSSVTKNVHSFK